MPGFVYVSFDCAPTEIYSGMRSQVPSSVEHGGAVGQTSLPPSTRMRYRKTWDGPVCWIARSCIFAQTRHRSELILT